MRWLARVGWNHQLERRALAVDPGRDGADRSAVPLDREPAEGEPEAPAAVALRDALVSALPVLAEERRQDVGRDRRSEVRDADDEAAARRVLGVDLDRAAVRGDADRVVDQVEQ